MDPLAPKAGPVAWPFVAENRNQNSKQLMVIEPADNSSVLGDGSLKFIE